jgi:hypothetical protein
VRVLASKESDCLMTLYLLRWLFIIERKNRVIMCAEIERKSEVLCRDQFNVGFLLQYVPEQT